MWRFGLASFVARTSSTMANDSAPIIGMWILGPEAVAIYSIALTLTQNARRVLDQAGTAIFPSVMKAGAIKDFSGLRSLYLRFMDISFAIGSLVFVGMIVFSGDFLLLWVGPEYSGGTIVVTILAFGYLMSGTCSTGPLSLASLDKINITMKIGLGEAVACVSSLLPCLACSEWDWLAWRLAVPCPGSFRVACFILGSRCKALASNYKNHLCVELPKIWCWPQQ